MDKKPFSSGTDKNSFSSPRFLIGFETKSVPITTLTLSSILTSISTLMLVTTHAHAHAHGLGWVGLDWIGLDWIGLVPSTLALHLVTTLGREGGTQHYFIESLQHLTTVV